MDVIKLLKRHEGFRQKPYRDTVGKLTVGYGRNLDDQGISEAEATELLQNDTYAARVRLISLPWFQELDGVRQAALIDMCVNMGFTRLLLFRRMLDALAEKNFGRAALEMLTSKWANQVGQRAIELAQMVRTGSWPADATE